MAGIIAVYSLVISVLIAGDLEPPPGQNYSLFKYVYHTKERPLQECSNFFPVYGTDKAFSGFMHLAAGLSVGLTGLAAGYAIGVVGDVVSGFTTLECLSGADRMKGVRSYMQQSRIFVGMVLILIFGEVLGLYGYAELYV